MSRPEVFGRNKRSPSLRGIRSVVASRIFRTNEALLISSLLQVQFAEAIKKAHPDVIVGAVGLIDTPQYAEQVLESHQADVIFLGRPFLRNPHWAIQAAEDLGVAVKPANQYERGWTMIRTPRTSADHHDRLRR